jgi:hypothetical protein
MDLLAIPATEVERVRTETERTERDRSLRILLAAFKVLRLMSFLCNAMASLARSSSGVSICTFVTPGTRYSGQYL